jgi:hypothetical protein
VGSVGVGEITRGDLSRRGPSRKGLARVPARPRFWTAEHAERVRPRVLCVLRGNAPPNSGVTAHWCPDGSPDDLPSRGKPVDGGQSHGRGWTCTPERYCAPHAFFPAR